MPRNQEINSTETPARDLAPANLGCAAPLRRDSIPALFSGPTLFLPRKLLQYRVFERFCGAQAHHRLGLDLDGLAGLRVAAHARLAVRFSAAPDFLNTQFSPPALP